MSRVVVGIDTGLASAVASSYGYANGLGPHLIDVYQIPTFGEEGGKRIDVEPFRDWLVGTGAEIAYIENASAMPDPDTGRMQGGGSIARYMRAAGAIETTVILSGLHPVFVQPAVWKTALGLIKADKKDSVRLARQLFPERANTLFKHWNSHNVAESCLIAAYAASRVDMITIKRPG